MSTVLEGIRSDRSHTALRNTQKKTRRKIPVNNKKNKPSADDITVISHAQLRQEDNQGYFKNDRSKNTGNSSGEIKGTILDSDKKVKLNSGEPLTVDIKLVPTYVTGENKLPIRGRRVEIEKTGNIKRVPEILALAQMNQYSAYNSSFPGIVVQIDDMPFPGILAASFQYFPTFGKAVSNYIKVRNIIIGVTLRNLFDLSFYVYRKINTSVYIISRLFKYLFFEKFDFLL